MRIWPGIAAATLLATSVPHALGAPSGSKPSRSEASPGLDLSRVPPPYDLRLSVFSLTYLVDAAQLRAVIPAELKLFEKLGKAFLIVLGAHYTETRAVGSRLEGPVYDEIAYMTVVSFREKRGGFFLKIHLDSPLARDLGRKLYGFPKDLATMSFQTDRETLTIASRSAKDGRLLGEVRLRRKGGLVGKLAGAAAEAAALGLGSLFRGALFKKGQSVVWADVTLRPAMGSGTVVHLERADFPYLRQRGFLTAQQASQPLAGILYERATLRLGKPVVLR
jgi:hypothetical protein